MGIRKPVSFSLDEELFKELDDYCEENQKNRSRLAEKLIKDELKKRKR